MSSEVYALSEQELAQVLRSAMRNGPLTEGQCRDVVLWAANTSVSYAVLQMAIGGEVALDFSTDPSNPVVGLVAVPA